VSELLIRRGSSLPGEVQAANANRLDSRSAEYGRIILKTSATWTFGDIPSEVNSIDIGAMWISDVPIAANGFKGLIDDVRIYNRAL
jgi:hypothetical protein